MEDGIRTGTLSAQSGHHGEVINAGQLDQLEIVKGPATLLYSGNAIGGTVNAVSRHQRASPSSAPRVYADLFQDLVERPTPWEGAAPLWKPESASFCSGDTLGDPNWRL